jgi:hypothetical protein
MQKAASISLSSSTTGIPFCSCKTNVLFVEIPQEANQKDVARQQDVARQNPVRIFLA